MGDDSKVYVSDREDGRFLSTMGLTHHLMKSGTAKLKFDPEMSREKFELWQGEVRAKLTELMCFPEAGDEQPEPVKLWAQARDGYRLEKWEAFPEAGSVVPFLVLIPDGVSESNPGKTVLCIPGSAQSKELLAGEPELRPEQPENRHTLANQMALQLVRAGFVSVVVENPGTAELDETPIDGGRPNSGRDKLCAELLMLGRNYVGLSVFQKQHIVRWLRTLPWVDADWLAISGHSLGTEPAMCMAVIDPSIKALVFNDFLSHNRLRYTVMAKADEAWSHLNPLWHVIPGLVEWFEFPDILGSLAPMPLIITEGGALEHLEAVQLAYEIGGAEGNFQYYFYPRYEDPGSRTHDHKPVPEGLSREEWFACVNVDAVNHNFKGNVAIPRLLEAGK
jgi:hypothetical protein